MIVNCSGCDEKNTQCRAHPLLDVPICSLCWDAYHTGEFTISDDGNEIYCRWCGEGGNICYCDVCPKSFCVDCIQRNFGSAEMHRILQLQDRWSCFLCSPQPIEDLCVKNGWDNLFSTTSSSSSSSSSSVYCQLSSSSSITNQRRSGSNVYGKKLKAITLPKNCICLDVTNGREKFSIPVYNEVDDAGPPLDFVYVNKNVSGGPYMTNNPSFLSCCTCTDNCQDPTRCECALLMNASFAYDEDKTLPRDQGSGVYECNDLCNCNISRCLNRLIGKGPTVPLEVFRCSDTRKGWGLRASVDIPSGTYIADYIGEVIDEISAERRGLVMGDEYLFNLDKFSRSQACQALSDLGFKNRPKSGPKSGTKNEKNGILNGQNGLNFWIENGLNNGSSTVITTAMMNDSDKITNSSSSNDNSCSNNTYIECDYDNLDVALLSKQSIRRLVGDDTFALLERHKAIDRIRLNYQQDSMSSSNNNNNNNNSGTSSSSASNTSSSSSDSKSSSGSSNNSSNSTKSDNNSYSIINGNYSNNSQHNNGNSSSSSDSSNNSSSCSSSRTLPSLIDILTKIDQEEENQIIKMKSAILKTKNAVVVKDITFVSDAFTTTSANTTTTITATTVTTITTTTTTIFSLSTTTTAETASTTSTTPTTEVAYWTNSNITDVANGGVSSDNSNITDVANGSVSSDNSYYHHQTIASFAIQSNHSSSHNSSNSKSYHNNSSYNSNCNNNSYESGQKRKVIVIDDDDDDDDDAITTSATTSSSMVPIVAAASTTFTNATATTATATTTTTTTCNTTTTTTTTAFKTTTTDTTMTNNHVRATAATAPPLAPSSMIGAPSLVISNNNSNSNNNHINAATHLNTTTTTASTSTINTTATAASNTTTTTTIVTDTKSTDTITPSFSIHSSLLSWFNFSKRRRVNLFRNACDIITDRAVIQAEKDFGSYTIDARWFGSVGRFLNHSCNPNLDIITVFADSHNAQIPRVAFFSHEFIKAKTELVYDYGYYEGNVADKHRDCLCGAIHCRKVLY